MRHSAGVGSEPGDRSPDPDEVSALPGARDCAFLVVAADSGRVLSMSRAAAELSGYSRAAVVGRPAWETVVPQDGRALLEAATVACVSAETPMNMLGMLHTADGHDVPVEWFVASLGRTDGAPRVLFYAETDPAGAGAARLFSHLIRVAADSAVLTSDLCGVVTFVSTGAAALLGLGPGELVGMPFPMGMLDGEQVAERAAALGLPVGPQVLVALHDLDGQVVGHLSGSWTVPGTSSWRPPATRCALR